MELNDYEKKHIDYLLNNASECTLFLKKNNEFPLSKPCAICLVGNGARKTIKGGTGSGDVASRFFSTCEEGLTKAGFSITSTLWMDKYDEFKKTTEKEYIKFTKKEARKAHILAGVYSMGFFEEEKNYSFSCDFDAEACIYVLARNSGEGNDRRNIKGDVKLSDKEVEDILYLNKKFKKFMLVLNVGGVVDLSEVKEVSNILLLSQLGVVTGDVLASIILGKTNPSGKLTTTWAKSEDYPCFSEFGNRDDTYYKEDIFVGYRYFLTANKDVLFPFGYGLSYSDFKLNNVKCDVKNFVVEIETDVVNVSNIPGKEVVEVYISKPNDVLPQAYIELCAYAKTDLLKKNETQKVQTNFNLLDFASYDESLSSYVLPKGQYVIRCGNSPLSLKTVGVISLKERIIVSKLNNKCVGNVDRMALHKKIKEDLKTIPHFELDESNVKTQFVDYKTDNYVDPMINELSDEELAHICVGHHKTGFAAIVGSSCENVVGGAGQTTLRVSSIQKSLTMADGPAGLRLKQIYGVDKKGTYDVELDPMMTKMVKFLPKAAGLFINPPKNRHGKIYHQYTTALPIGTALAQSFNNAFVKECGKIVKEEMELFNVDLWLAPALNIHRNILCGRNFEYFSEDPFLSGMIAASIVKGVEEDGRKGATIKHFACNNQEFNRNNNNSHVSERALREIYLKGFEICIRESNPKSIMTSYNLLNGVHTSENYELLNDIVRCEWKYDGLIMTDWIASGRSFCSRSYYPAPYASNNIKAGNDLTMSGSPRDYKDIMKALKKGKLTREELVRSASRIYRSIKKQKDN